MSTSVDEIWMSEPSSGDSDTTMGSPDLMLGRRKSFELPVSYSAKRKAIVVPGKHTRPATADTVGVHSLHRGSLDHTFNWSLPELRTNPIQPKEKTFASYCSLPNNDNDTMLRRKDEFSNDAKSIGSLDMASVADSRPMSSLILVEATDENSTSRMRESNWFRSQPDSPCDHLARHTKPPLLPVNNNGPSPHFEKLLLRAQDQRNHAMNESAQLQGQLEKLQQSSDAEITRLKEELAQMRRKLQIEYELRTIAETKCARMECELAELSSNIQFEAQNLVAVERRGHLREVESLVKKQREMEHLMEVNSAQVTSLKGSLETVAGELDRERKECERLRATLTGVERQIAGSSMAVEQSPPINSRSSSKQSSASTISIASSRPSAEPHILGQVFFGNDATRSDTRLAEFLGFLNLSDKEAATSAFVQRSMREDVEPTIVPDHSSMPSLSAWQRHRRLLHSVQENTLALESFAPKANIGRVLSLGCYLCGCSTSRPSTALDRAGLSTSDEGRMRNMYRMRFGDHDEDNKPLCNHCHGRMVAVCSFFAYLRIVRKGLIKRPIADIWLEVNKARLQMWLARSGASADSRLSIADGPLLQ
ncbi:hypothetical protein GGI25_003899 [Coemansia spiralis]|uniref:GDP/GTP exchange factor Sec2 N-terminal domain-containing protein n=2 Tax=Coemansia TaxID=4863 RepID=A0A9W8KXM4_9FUNG|nr:hypothetical protein EDC05_003655 [Coemansia umbellata]KAJ2621133.1 hypothetical protein GGI26_004396 [Coemansia sp. RSA 1358]KAJ2675701.1 hypothetical protein GGI25_003899 [Coemansia spiralis]